MPQTQGAGTVYAGGPGTKFRGPLYVSSGPSGSSNAPTVAKLCDDTGVVSGAALGYQQVTVTSTQLKALNTTPIKIISAAGAGTLVEVVRVIANLVYGTATYANGGALSITYASGGPACATTVPAALVTAAQNEVWYSSESVTTQQTSANVLNKDLYLAAATADFITGDGVLVLRIWTRTHAGLA